MVLLRTILISLVLLSAWVHAQEQPAAPLPTTEPAAGFLALHPMDAKGRVLVRVDGLDTPFMLVTSLPGGLGSNEVGLDRAQVGEPRIVRFLRAGNRLALVEDSTRFIADSNHESERRAVSDAFARSVIWTGDILDAGASAPTVDIAGLIASDLHGIIAKIKATGQGDYTLDPTRSLVLPEASRTFSDNSEFEALLTFTGAGEGEFVREVAPNPRALTLRQHLSFVRLPGPGFVPRVYHPFSGSYSTGALDFAQPLSASLERRFQPRFRLEKLDPDAERSKVRKPIVFHLDPGTPEPIRSALLDGARWWAEAFEAAGFIDAFRVEVLPSYLDPQDIKVNMITWTHRATRGWSYGGTLIDPRTGEIIKGYVNLGSQRVRQDILIAEALLAPWSAADPGALANEAREMALARLRQLAAHEIGHALGLAHNFAASRHGNGSVLDYPHPLITLDGQDRIRVADAYGSGLGDWDIYAIRHGYQQFAPGQEQAGLAQLRAQIRAAGFAYIGDADARAPGDAHADGLLWDFGTDSVDSLEHLLRVRSVALERFSPGVLPPQRQTGEFEARLVPVYLLHRYQTEAAARLIAGETYSYGLSDEPSPGTQRVDAALQLRALDRVLKTVSLETLRIPAHVLALMTPMSNEHLRSREYFPNLAGPGFDPLSAAGAATALSAQLLFDPARLNRLAIQHSQDARIPSVRMLIDRTFADAFTAADTGSTASIILETRDRVLLHALMHAQRSGRLHASVELDLRTALRELAERLGNSSVEHAGETAGDIRAFLDRPESFILPPLPVIPPGAPI